MPVNNLEINFSFPIGFAYGSRETVVASQYPKDEEHKRHWVGDLTPNARMIPNGIKGCQFYEVTHITSPMKKRIIMEESGSIFVRPELETGEALKYSAFFFCKLASMGKMNWLIKKPTEKWTATFCAMHEYFPKSWEAVLINDANGSEPVVLDHPVFIDVRNRIASIEIPNPPIYSNLEIAWGLK